MKDFYNRIRAHDRYNRRDASNKLVRTRAKREAKREADAAKNNS